MAEKTLEPEPPPYDPKTRGAKNTVTPVCLSPLRRRSDTDNRDKKRTQTPSLTTTRDAVRLIIVIIERTIKRRNRVPTRHGARKREFAYGCSCVRQKSSLNFLRPRARRTLTRAPPGRPLRVRVPRSFSGRRAPRGLVEIPFAVSWRREDGARGEGGGEGSEVFWRRRPLRRPAAAARPAVALISRARLDVVRRTFCTVVHTSEKRIFFRIRYVRRFICTRSFRISGTVFPPEIDFENAQA